MRRSMRPCVTQLVANPVISARIRWLYSVNCHALRACHLVLNPKTNAVGSLVFFVSILLAILFEVVAFRKRPQ